MEAFIEERGAPREVVLSKVVDNFIDRGVFNCLYANREEDKKLLIQQL